MAKNISHMDLLMAVSAETDLTKLDQLSNAIRNRKESLSQIKLSLIKAGDTVRFSPTIRPTYLAGLEAKAVDVNRKTVVVSFPRDAKYGRFSGSQRVRVPMSCLA